MATAGNSDRLMSDINVTPFVDVMLVLLIIFMVTAPMMVQGVNVDLPEATAAPMSTDQEPLMLSIDAQGRVFINDVPVEVGFLRDKLDKILEGRGSREVYLRADKTIPYGVVVRVMAEIQAAGVDKLGMVTVPGGDDARENEKRKE
ncbi:MAG: protein TolR [Desulfobacterales bacterium]|jgi:biopolymer transport protein TolR